MKLTRCLAFVANFASLLSLCNADADAPTCSIEQEEVDPNLHEISFDIGYGLETFDVYIRPDIASFTNGEYTKAMTPRMSGHACKFFNMSPNKVKLMW